MKSHGNTVFIEAFRSCHCETNLWIGIQGSLVGIMLIVYVFITPIDGHKCSLKQQHWREE